MGIEELEDIKITNEWNIVGSNGTPVRKKAWRTAGYLDGHLKRQHRYHYVIVSDKTKPVESARKECHRRYDGRFIIEYEITRRPVKVVPASEYIDELFDREFDKACLLNKKEQERERKRELDKQKAEQARRKKLYEELKEEFDG